MERRNHFNSDENKGNFDLPDHGRQKLRCANPPCGPHAHAMDKLDDHIAHRLLAHSGCFHATASDDGSGQAGAKERDGSS